MVIFYLFFKIKMEFYFSDEVESWDKVLGFKYGWFGVFVLKGL